MTTQAPLALPPRIIGLPGEGLYTGDGACWLCGRLGLVVLRDGQPTTGHVRGARHRAAQERLAAALAGDDAGPDSDEARAWNAAHPVGRVVLVSVQKGRPLVAMRTASRAASTLGGVAVVLVDGAAEPVRRLAVLGALTIARDGGMR